MRTRDIEKELAALEERKKTLTNLLMENKSKTKVKCLQNRAYRGKACGKSHMIKDLIYIQILHYEPPVSCWAGDYWYNGEGQFTCPSCGYRNRLYDRPEIQKMKSLFKGVKEEEHR